ncbi:hypothetical protein [Enterococcus sp.]|uniref:hypothetical protein n=1 Tax=Enterococcus sp. TaxID=35783 RepID=UPI002FC9B4F7
MRKVSLLALLFCFLVVLNGCKNNDYPISTSYSTTPKDSTSQKNDNTSISSSEVNHAVSFKKGLLKTQDYEFEILKTQIGYDTAAKETGLVLWIRVKNTSKKNIIPSDILDHFYITQEDGKSIYDVSSPFNGFDAAEAIYPMYDDEGLAIDDIETYNLAVNNQNEFSEKFEEPFYAELLPDKEIEVVAGITIKNDVYPVRFSLTDKFNISDDYVVELIDTDAKGTTSSEKQSEKKDTSDIPEGWQGTEAEWLEAKAQGWTKEDYEKQQKVSESESSPNLSSVESDLNNLSLTEFVDKYGISIVGYKVQNGMSLEDALSTTSDSKKTSGEIQLEQ